MDAEFFEPIPEPPEPQRWEPPPWFQPPEDEFAALVPVRQILVRTQSGVVVLLSHIDAYSSGCVFRIRASAHRQGDVSEDDWIDRRELMMGGRRHGHRRGGGELPDELFRCGVQFSDGNKATTTGAPWPPHIDERPEGHVLRQNGGGGSGGDRVATTSWALWLWPLPPPEPFDLVCSWPAFGIRLERITVDGNQIVEAASRSGPFWGGSDSD